MPQNPLFPTSNDPSKSDSGQQSDAPQQVSQIPIEPLAQPLDPEPRQPIRRDAKPHHQRRAASEDEQAAIFSDQRQQGDSKDANPAANLIREKIERLYATEPDTRTEILEAEAAPAKRSKHQQYMHELSNSGRSLADIQTAWHEYYRNLPDNEKHQVWQEFYDNSSRVNQQPAAESHQFSEAVDSTGTAKAEEGRRNVDTAAIYPTPTALEDPKPRRNPLQTSETMPEAGVTDTSESKTAASQPSPQSEVAGQGEPLPFGKADKRSASDIRKQLRGNVRNRGKLTAKHHLQSLAFGLGFGGLVLLIVLFSFFNEVIIAPFIQPSRKVSATPIIVSTDGTAASNKDEVIIPKINLEIPLDFSVTTTNEAGVETALENGVVHYPTTVKPGQQGNTAFFGHSSNNIFNPGKYKFAFVLLHELVPGDTFYLTHDGVTYAYQVYDKKIVQPSEVSVLNNVPGKTATATLITCDPPGTSINRLVVWGEQVSPNPASNTQATPQATSSGAEQALPGNGPTLWRRFVNWVTGN